MFHLTTVHTTVTGEVNKQGFILSLCGFQCLIVIEITIQPVGQVQEIRVFHRFVGCGASGTLCSTHLHATLHDLFRVVTHNTVNIEVYRFLRREISGQSLQRGSEHTRDQIDHE